MEIELDPGETVIAEAGTMVYMEQGISFDVKMGDGLFLSTIKGTGKVWLQSMPVRKLIRALAPTGRNKGKEAGSILGSLFER